MKVVESNIIKKYDDNDAADKLLRELDSLDISSPIAIKDIQHRRFIGATHSVPLRI